MDIYLDTKRLKLILKVYRGNSFLRIVLNAIAAACYGKADPRISTNCVLRAEPSSATTKVRGEPTDGRCSERAITVRILVFESRPGT